MVSFTEQCVVLILSISFCFLLISTAEISKKEPSGVKNSKKLKKPLLSANLSSPDVNVADFMPMDATPGTTPEFCPAGVSCGFVYFATVRGELEYRPQFYCSCPDDQECVKLGVNNRQCFFYYGCRNTTQVVSSTEAGIRNATEFVLSATSMVPQNAASEPVPSQFEREFPVPSHC